MAKEYIERSTLDKWLHETMSAQTTVRGMAFTRMFWDKVRSIPATDVVEVVRCRDCKHRGTDECVCHVKGEPADEELLKKLDNDFCSYGERRTAMATKKICDRCGAEITDVSHFAGLSTYRYEGKLTHELCCSCAYHLGRWLDGKEQMCGEWMFVEKERMGNAKAD